MDLAWQKISEESTKVGYKWVTNKTFRLPNGTEANYTTWHKPGTAGAAIVAITPEHKIVIAKQYRPGPEKFLYELPGGFLDPNEDALTAAARELEEETGYASNEPVIAIGSNCADAYTNNTNYYFLAKNCTKRTKQKLEDTEFVEIIELTIPEVIEHAKNGEMSDAVAILCAYDELQKLIKQ